MKSVLSILAVTLLLAAPCLQLQSLADDIIIAPDGVTDFFGNGNGVADEADAAGLLFDECRTGGGDTAAQAAFNPSRFLLSNEGSNENWAAGLTTGMPEEITITGLGLPFRGGTTATIVSVTITYLGADGAVGGVDDEIVGIRTDDLDYSVVQEYAWQFTDPMVFAWDGLNTRFRISMTGIDGNLRFKQRAANESPSGQGGLPLSVAGFVGDGKTILLGDVNLDGEVNLLDVQPFVELLTNGGFQLEADINGDGFADLLDVQPFVRLLTGE